MDHRQSVLILHASAGHGHEKAASAVAEAFRDSAETSVFDSLDYTLPFFGHGYKNLYLNLIRYAPWIWGLLYYGTDWRWLPLVRIIRRMANAVAASPLAALITKTDPDVIVCTHFLPAEVASALKRRGRIRSRVVVVVTDFMPHAFWIVPGADYAVASTATKEELVRRGVPAERVAVTGIPVDPKFSKKLERQEARRRLGLEVATFTLLITSGGAGVGTIEEIVDRIVRVNSKIQIVVVCGTNEALRARLERSANSKPGLKILGFVDNMDELMDAADLVLGKAGGLTLSESFAKGLPVLIFKPVPGQESRNASCVVKRGAGLEAHTSEEAALMALDILLRFDRLMILKKNAAAMGSPESAKHVALWAGRG